jgi:CRISPR-associated endonuclease/helicase Cas3
MSNLQCLSILLGKPPFPWQEELLRKFVSGQIPSALDIPTGLGKTAVMAIWLAARASGASVPRRLFYIVDRRAVVDQATDDALRLRDSVEKDANIKTALRLSDALPISTLRGQHVDNRKWQEDPASPAIVVGTIDMIGSRLLFEGYGISRKMRPYQAGLIGADSLIVLDEAHLVPAFEKLLETISHSETLRPDTNDRRQLVPGLRLLALSATGGGDQAAFGLGAADYQPGTITHQRLTAVKRLRFESLGEDENFPKHWRERLGR